jgi:ring-1,2-phenylacetyl-CoA epoxidase subunit PaaE
MPKIALMNYLSLKIAEISQQPGDNLVIKFEQTPEQIHYTAGQFLTFIFDVKGKEVRRSYSLYSSPALNEPLSIAVKLVENGEISRLLHHKTRVGDLLKAVEPNGIFTYLPFKGIQRTVFLFAAGVGITPIFSILKTALLEEDESKIILVYSNRSAEDALFYQEIKDWEARYPDRLKVIFFFSNAKNIMQARLNKFMIEKLVLDNMQFDPQQALFYTCGPIDYMVNCRIVLLGLKYGLDQIKRETYYIPEDEMDEDDTTEKQIADKNTYRVIIDWHENTYELEVPYFKRILDVALDQNINLPYSCTGGICSTCTSTCVSGGVRMDYNEVLTDEEIAAGRVLLCTGHPTANDTRIVIG